MSEAGIESTFLTSEEVDAEFRKARNLVIAAKDSKLTSEKRRFNAEVLAKKIREVRSKVDPKIFMDLPPIRKYIRVDRNWGKNWGFFYNYEDGSLYEGPSIDQESASPNLKEIKPIQDVIAWADNGQSIIDSLHSFIDLRQSQSAPKNTP